MKKILKKWTGCLTVVIAIAGVTLSGCSSSEMKNDEEGEEAPNTEAPTDAIPQDSVEAVPEEGSMPIDAGAQSAPLPESAMEMTAPEIPAQTVSYTVQKGDTLMKIAFERYGDLFQWRRIQDLNRDKISDPNRLVPGTVLALEDKVGVEVSRTGEKYQIKQGDTLGSISQDVYGSKKKWKRIWENNRQLISDPNKIFAGFYLYYTFTAEDEKHRIQHQPVPVSKSPKSEPKVAEPSAEVKDERGPASLKKTFQKQEAKVKKAVPSLPKERKPSSELPRELKSKRQPSSVGPVAPSKAAKYPSAVNKWLKKK